MIRDVIESSKNSRGIKTGGFDIFFLLTLPRTPKEMANSSDRFIYRIAGLPLEQAESL